MNDMLPPASTPLEKAVSLTGAARHPLPTSLPRDFWNHETCPAHLLGWLALQVSADVWDDAWPVERKRYVIGRSIELHRVKGTEFALREYLTLAGYKTTRVVTPPQGFFASADLDREAMEAWLSTLPEIRLYRLRGIGNPNNLSTSGVAATVAGCSFVIDDGESEYGGFYAADPLSVQDASRREAILIEHGVETVLRVSGENSQDVEKFFIPRQNAAVMYAGGLSDGSFALGEYEPFNIVSIRRAGALDWWNLAHHGRAPINALPKKVSSKVPDSAGFFAGRSADNAFATTGQNDRYRYESWRLAAEGRTALTPSAASFADHSRVSMDPKTAEVTIDTRKPGPAGAIFASTVNGMYAMNPDHSQYLAQPIRAVSASRSQRDRILIDPIAVKPTTVQTAKTLDDLKL